MTQDRPPPDLSRFEELARSGDNKLRNELVEEHLTLARGFARRYANRGVSTEDLEQVARLGLIAAVDRFDPTVGVRFVTFAGRTIDGELKRHFRDKAWSVRVPRRYQNLGVAIRGAVDTLSKDLGRSPTVAELARTLGAEVDEVIAAMEAAQAFRADSIDSTVPGEDATTTVADNLSSRDLGPTLFDNRELVSGLLDQLSDQERKVVELRFFSERSQSQIAAEVGVSQMQVSRLLRKSLAKLRQNLEQAAEASDPPPPE